MNSGGTMELLGGKNTFTGNKMNATIAEGRRYKVGGGAVINQSHQMGSGDEIDSTMVIGKTDGSSTNTFTGNSSSTSGGAVMNRAVDTDGNATLTINGNTTFSNNTAEASGGAIYNVAHTGRNASVTFNNNATFSGNEAKGTISSMAGVYDFTGQGGAIYNSGGDLTFNGETEFSGNKAASAGGAIGNLGGTLTFNDSATFTGNQVTGGDGQGGAVRNASGTINFNDGVTFTGNTSTTSGSAIYNALHYGTPGTVNIKGDALFQENNGNYAIHNVSNDTVDNLVAFSNGDVTFKDNIGGAIWNQDKMTFTNMDDILFEGNTQENNSASAISNVGTMTIGANTFTVKENEYSGTNKLGAAIGNTSASSVFNLTANTVEFSDNIGGAIYKENDNFTITANEILFVGNSGSNASAINNNGNTSKTTLTADNVVFNGNTSSSSYGGAIFNSGNYVKIFSDDITFTNNEANGTTTEEANKIKFGGGAIQNRGNTATTQIIIGNDANSNILFENNYSASNGGAIHARAEGASNVSTIDINGDTTFSGNEALWNGGAISNSPISGTANLTFNGDTTFTGNTAGELGGAIYNTGSVTFNGNATFTGNTANEVANDIYNAGTLNFNNATAPTTEAENATKISLGGGIDGTGSIVVNSGASDVGVVGIEGVINNQAMTVAHGELKLDSAKATLSGTTTVAVNNGATINTIDNVINNYTDKVTLSSGAVIKGDIDYVAGTADRYLSSGGTVTYKMANALTVGKEGDTPKYIQVASDGTTVSAAGDFAFTSENGMTLVGSGSADGRVRVIGTAGGINTAVDVTDDGTPTNINYTVTADETFDGNGGTDNVIANSNFTINGQGTEAEKPAITLAMDMIVGDASKPSTLTLNQAKLTGNSALQNTAGSTLDITDSEIGVLVKNYGTLTSDPTTYKGGIENYEGATATITGDTFTTIDRTGNNGGAIWNEAGGVLTLNTDTFTNNTADNGGAIYNEGTATINGGSFSGNTAVANGGAIYNATGATLSVTDSTFTSNTAVQGGDIYNAGTATILANTADMNVNNLYNAGTLNLNSAADKTLTIGGIGGASGTGSTTINSGSQTGTVVFGGAVANDVVVAAGTLDNNAQITGNVTVNAGAILSSTIANAGTLTNNGTFNLEGAALGNVAGTGTTVLQNNVSDATTNYTIAGTLDANGKEIKLIGDSVNYNTLTVGKLVPNSATLKVDINGAVGGTDSDKLIISGATSTGSISLTDIKVNGYVAQKDDYNVTHQIIQNATGSDLALTLGITSDTLATDASYNYNDSIAADTSWSHNYLHHEITDATVTATFALDTTTTAYDSITTTIATTGGTDHTSSLGDTLALVVQATTPTTRTFTADTDTDYTVTDALGTLGGTQLSIIGTGHTAKILGNNKTGIVIGNNAQTLDITDVAGMGGFSGAAVDNTAGGTVNVSGSTLTSGIVNDGEGAKGVFLTGANSISSIVDSAATGAKGQTTIGNGVGAAESDVTTITGALTQKNVNILSDGKLIIGAGNLTAGSGVSNAGTLELGDGTLSSGVSGVGHTDIVGTVTNAAGNTISQAVNVGTDDGTTVVPGSLDNAGTLDAATVNVTADSELDNSGNIYADDINNAGTTNFNDGYVEADNIITDNSGDTDAATNFSGGDVDADNITNNGGTNTFDGADVEAGAITNNDGTTSIEDGSVDADTIENVAGDTNIIGGDVTADDIINSADNGTLNINQTTIDPETGEPVSTGSVIADAITNSGSGNTEISSVVEANTVASTGEDGIVNLNATPTDTSTSDLISNANVTIADGATVAVNTAADNYSIDNAVTGSGTGDGAGTLDLNGYDESGYQTADDSQKTKFTIDNAVDNTVVNVNEGQLDLADESNLTNSTVHVAGPSDPEGNDAATVNTKDGNSTKYTSNEFEFEDQAEVKFDVDAKAKNSDRFENNDTAENPDNQQILTDISLQNLDKIVRKNTNINLKDTSNLSGLTVSDELQGRKFQAMTPIRIMEATINAEGMMNIHPSSGRNDYDSFNPAAVVSVVAAQLGGYLSQLNSYDEAFRNLDMKMLMTQEERKAMKMANSYASEVRPQVFSETYLPEKDSAGWFRPYASFEKVNLQYGPNAENNMYGSYFGGDSKMYETKNGWDYQYSVYVGYNGSHQNFQRQSIYQNGGNIGATGIWYKGDFFTALTANVGASVANASTTFGNEDFAMLMTGVASKTGYNWELAKGKFIIQPNYLMSYTFVNTFDYTNAAGVRINTKPLNAINIAPGVKFIGNLKNGWQPYVSLRMVWNVMDKADFHANDIPLPEMSVKPYFQYGLGLQKRWGDRFTGFGQLMFRNGGRNGIAMSAGFRWAIGKEYTERTAARRAQKGTVIKQQQKKDQNIKNVNNSVSFNNNSKGFFSKMDGEPTYVVKVPAKI